MLHEAFQDYNIDAMDAPSKYFEWRDLEEEKTKLILDSSLEPK